LATKELSCRVSRIVNGIEDLAHLLLDLREGRETGTRSPAVSGR
jgi:hypothetical protein